MQTNKIYNGDCLQILKSFPNNQIDIILTSPPYNTSNKRRIWQVNQKTHYDIDSVDKMTDEQYKNWLVQVFELCSLKLKDDGCILINLSYSAQKPFLMYELILKIVQETILTLVDTIIWEKNSALPNNMNSNRLTRICEFVFVLCKKGHEKTFKTNKQVVSIDRKGVKKYNSIKNIFKAKNNDGNNPLNKATFSTEFVVSLLNIYSYDKENIVLDPFMGTGTTACGCIAKGINYIGIELSNAQCEFAQKRISDYVRKISKQG